MQRCLIIYKKFYFIILFTAFQPESKNQTDFIFSQIVLDSSTTSVLYERLTLGDLASRHPAARQRQQHPAHVK